MPGHVLISCMHVFDQMDEVGPRLERHDITWDLAEFEGQQLSEQELLSIIDRYDGVIAGDDEITAKVLEAGAPRLRVVAKWGIGIDGIDAYAAERLGVEVRNTPGVFGHEIADYALGYLILLHRHHHRLHAGTARGEWPKLRGHSIAGRTLGIVGLGSSGRGLAHRAHVMGMGVIGHDVVAPDPSFLEAADLEFVELSDVWSRSDVISLHAPLTSQTRHLVNSTSIDQMKDGVMFINTARGGLVDEQALIQGLQSGRVAAAALDVFEQEPLPSGHPFTTMENVVLGSHNASNTHEAVVRTTDAAVTNLLDALGTSS